MLMMQIAERKKCFLVDLEQIPASEFKYWLAFYELEGRRQKKEMDASSRGKR